jgi:Protein of unknown function (DUF3108)
MQRCRAVIVAALVLTMWAAQALAQAGSERIPLAYSVRFRGVEIVQLTIDAQVTRTNYDVNVSAWTTGLFGGLYPWRLSASSAGRIERGAPVATRHASESRLGSTTRRLEIDYRNGRIAAVRRSVQPPAEEVFEGVPERERENAVDGITAILAALLRAGSGAGCPQSIMSFDGRRLVEIAFTPLVQAQAAGAALTCEFRSDSRDKPLAGHERRWRAGRVVMASVGPDGQSAPSRIETETRWGSASAVLLRPDNQSMGAGLR